MGAISKSVLLLLLLIFYAVITVLLGFNTNIDSQTKNVEQKSSLWSFGNAITSIGILPWWVNAIIFTPLILVLGFIILTSFIPTLDGGM
jgi:hypothetical protein